jgi:E3 ubiquitin-protein ligase NEDD4
MHRNSDNKGWEMALDPQGRPYFIDHINKTTTYSDPRTIPQQTYLAAFQTQLPLPHGWEMSFDNMVLFITIQ